MNKIIGHLHKIIANLIKKRIIKYSETDKSEINKRRKIEKKYKHKIKKVKKCIKIIEGGK